MSQIFRMKRNTGKIIYNMDIAMRMAMDLCKKI